MRDSSLLYRWPALYDAMAGPADSHAQLVADLVPRDRAVLLDLGCGTGRVSRAVLEQLPRWDVWGIDWQPDLIEYAAVVCPKATWQVCDIREAHIGRIADVVLCLDVLEDMIPRQIRRVLTTAVQHCRAGTILVLQVTVPDLTEPTTQEVPLFGGDVVRCETRMSVGDPRGMRQTITRDWSLPDRSTLREIYSRWGLHQADLIRELRKLGFSRYQHIKGLLVCEFTGLVHDR